MHRLRSQVVLLLLLSLLLPAVAGAQENESGVTLEVRTPFGEYYRPYHWLPLHITAANAGPDRSVELRVGQFATELELPRGARKEVTLYVRPTPSTRFEVIATSSGQEIARTRVRLLTNNRPLVNVVGEAEARPRGIELIPVGAQLLPSRAEGLEALSAVVLDGRQRVELSSQQLEALEAWVGSGGSLLITAGSAMEELLSALPASLRPAQAALNDSDTVSSAPLAALVGRSDDPGPITALRLIPAEQARVVAADQRGRPLLVSKLIGTGRVMALAFPLDAAPLARWEGLDQLWQRLAPEQRAMPMWDPSMTINQLRDQQAPAVLSNLPALDLPPLRWLLILLAIYILLVGPVSYLVLRWLDRLAWAWFSIPALTLTFALLTYGIGAGQRGSDLILNQVTVVEQAGANSARVHGYASIFSPQRATYDLQGPQGALLRPLEVAPWGPTSSAASASFLQSSESVNNLRVNQWSQEMLGYNKTIRWQGLQASLTLAEGSVTGKVTNAAQQTIRQVALVIGGNLLKLGDLQPGQSAPVELPLQNPLVSMGESLGYQLYEWNELGPEGPPRELQLKVMALDLAIPAALTAGHVQPVLLGWLDHSPLDPIVPGDDQRHTLHQTSLVFSRPVIDFGVSAITLDSAWLTIETGGFDNREMCSTRAGLGLPLQARTTDMVFSLPRQAVGFSPNALVLDPQVENMPFVEELIIRAFNWHSGEKEVLTQGLKRVEIEDPQRYITPGGELQLSIELPEQVEQMGGFWSCFSAGLELRGRLP